MTDREVEAISDFLRHFGRFGCRQISVRRAEPKPRTPEDVGRFVLASLAACGWKGLMPSGCTKSPRSRFTSRPTSCPGPSACPRAAGRGGRWNPHARQGRAAR